MSPSRAFPSPAQESRDSSVNTEVATHLRSPVTALSPTTSDDTCAVSAAGLSQLHLRQENRPTPSCSDNDDKTTDERETPGQDQSVQSASQARQISIRSCMKGTTQRRLARSVALPQTPERRHCKLYRKEIALDRLQAADRRETGLPSAAPNLSTLDGSEMPWWKEGIPINDALWEIATGEVAVVTKNQHHQFADTDLLPPPYGAAYVSHPELNPLAETASPVRAIFKVDSCCEPQISGAGGIATLQSPDGFALG